MQSSSSALLAPEKPRDLGQLMADIELAIEELGWAKKQRTGNRTHWVVNHPPLLSGLRKAAEVSLRQEGDPDPKTTIAAMLNAYRGNEFLAYRSLLNEKAVIALTERFRKIATEHLQTL